MRVITEECRKLNEMLLNSGEYRRYVAARNALNNAPEVAGALRDLRRRNDEIHLYGGENAFEEMEKLVAEYDELLHNSVANEYIRAESRLSSLVREMIDEQLSGIELEMFGIGE